MLRYGGAEVRRCGGAEVRRCGGAEVRRCGGAEVVFFMEVMHHPLENVVKTVLRILFIGGSLSRGKWGLLRADRGYSGEVGEMLDVGSVNGGDAVFFHHCHQH